MTFDTVKLLVAVIKRYYQLILFGLIFFSLFFVVASAASANVSVLPPSNILPRINPFAAVGAFIRLVLIVGFVVAMFYIFFGAIRWITAGGDKAALESARGHLGNAIIGLIILLSVFAILFFIETFFGVEIITRGPTPGEFTIPTVPHLNVP